MVTKITPQETYVENTKNPLMEIWLSVRVFTAQLRVDPGR